MSSDCCFGILQYLYQILPFFHQKPVSVSSPLAQPDASTPRPDLIDREEVDHEDVLEGKEKCQLILQLSTLISLLLPSLATHFNQVTRSSRVYRSQYKYRLQVIIIYYVLSILCD